MLAVYIKSFLNHPASTKHVLQVLMTKQRSKAPLSENLPPRDTMLVCLGRNALANQAILESA